MKSNLSLIFIIFSILNLIICSDSIINLKDSSITDLTFENTVYPSFKCDLKILKIKFDENIDPSQAGIIVYKTKINIHIIKTSHLNVFPIKYDMEFTWNVDEMVKSEESEKYTIEKNKNMMSILDNPLLKEKKCIQPEISQESEKRVNYKIKISYDSLINIIKYYRKEGYGDVYSISTILPDNNKVKIILNFVVDSQCTSLNDIYEMLKKICNDDD